MIKSNSNYILVIGAANIDIGGTPHKPLIHADSNPGNISINYGGVGRNIAHNLSKLGVPVKLIAAFGGDAYGIAMKKYCEDLGIDTSCSVTLPGEISSMYLYINDSSGDMDAAISHVDIISSITPEYIDSVIDVLNNAAMVVVDCNLMRETILHIRSVCTAPVFIETVSTSHAGKIRGELDGFDIIKTNRKEAELLTGLKINNVDDCISAAHNIIDQGSGKVFITMGSEGIVAAEGESCVVVRSCKSEVVSTTGAGDAAAAGIVWSLIYDDSNVIINNSLIDNSLISASIAANVIASMTVEASETISPELSETLLIDRVNYYQSYTNK